MINLPTSSFLIDLSTIPATIYKELSYPDRGERSCEKRVYKKYFILFSSYIHMSKFSINID